LTGSKDMISCLSSSRTVAKGLTIFLMRTLCRICAVIILGALLGELPAEAQPLTIKTIAGQFRSNFHEDGTGTDARLEFPSNVVIDRADNIYLIEGSSITKVTPDLTVKTLAGDPVERGYADGQATDARFSGPSAIAVDRDGNVFVADTFNRRIRKVSPSGLVTTVAGDGTDEMRDGSVATAEFSFPRAIAVDAQGNIFVGDAATLREITKDGVVKTIAGDLEEGTVDGVGAQARFAGIFGLAVADDGTIYVADIGTIRKVTPAGAVTTWVGNPLDDRTEKDGTGADAGFHDALSIALDGTGGAYVADSSGPTIRHVTKDGVVTTVAGLAKALADATNDGVGGEARFVVPSGVAVDSKGNVYITDAQASTLLRGTPSGGTNPPPQGCVPPPDGLVSWWRGEGNALDSLGANNGILEGNATATRDEVAGLGFVLDGQSAIEVPNNPSLQPKNVSVEAWVLPRDLNNPASTIPGLQYIVFKRNSRTVNFEGYALMKRVDAAGVPRFSFQTTSSAGVNAAADSTTTVAANTIYHLVGTYDGTKTALYVNGKLESSADAPFALDYGNSSLFIGASGEPNFEGKFIGELDEISLYNRALNPTEVAALHDAGAYGKCTNNLPAAPCVPTPSGVVAAWAGNGDAVDSVGQNNLPLKGVTYSGGMVGQAFQFDGTANSYGYLPDTALLHNKKMTFEGWFNFAAINNDQILVFKHVGTGDAPVTASFAFEYHRPDGLVAAAGGTHGTIALVTHEWNPVVGQWYHLAFTADDSTGEVQLFVDGQLVARKAVFPNTMEFDAHPVLFGLYGSGQYGFTGRMDELAFYNRVLSPGEIRSIYSAGSAGKCPSAQTQTVTAHVSGPTDFPPAPPGLDLVLDAAPPTPTAPPVNAQVMLNNPVDILRTTLGATPGSTLELIVNALLKSKVIEIRDGGILVVQNKVVGQVENLAGIISRDPALTEKIKAIGSLVEDNKPFIDRVGLPAVVSLVQPQITKILADLPAGGAASLIHATQASATGAIQIDGDYLQDQRGILAIAIQGTNFISGGAQQYDRLQVSGTATLTGQIGFGLLNSAGGIDGAVFEPPIGSVFDVVVASQIIATNLTIRGPIWGTGVQFLPVIAQFPDGRESLRLIATNVAPVMDIQSNNAGVQVSFPANYLGHYVLQATESLLPTTWQDIPGNVARVPIANDQHTRFFRLKKI
jgi:sugar lactone lactonase YvrE